MPVRSLHMGEGNSNVLNESDAAGNLLLEIGVSLLESGANNDRIRTTMSELSATFHYLPEITIGTNSVTLVLNDAQGNALFHDVRRPSAHGINFAVISQVSRLGRMAAENQWSVSDVKTEFINCKSPGGYPRLIVLSFVSLAGAAFCYTFGGSYTEMAITFGATFCGLFVKQQLAKARFNAYFITYIAAITASFFTGFFHITGLIHSPVSAFSTCVLFLIPGVVLINSFTDLIEGSTMNGMAKGVNAFIHILAIALGLLTTILIFNLKG